MKLKTFAKKRFMKINVTYTQIKNYIHTFNMVRLADKLNGIF